MPKKRKPRIFLYRASKEPEKPDEPKYDASRRAVRLGLRDVSIDPRTGIAIMDSGEIGSHGDDFRSIHDMLADGEDLLESQAFAQNYRYTRKVVHYDG